MTPESGGNAPRHKPGFWGRWSRRAGVMLSSPEESIGWRSVLNGANLLRYLMAAFREKAVGSPSTNLVLRNRDLIDLRASARFRGLAEEQFLALIHRRQRETFRIAVAAGLLDLVLFLAWAIEMIFGHWTGSRLFAAIEFVPFLVMIGYLCLNNCSMNWQLRTRRVATLRQFLDESDSLFPRLP